MYGISIQLLYFKRKANCDKHPILKCSWRQMKAVREHVYASANPYKPTSAQSRQNCTFPQVIDEWTSKALSRWCMTGPVWPETGVSPECRQYGNTAMWNLLHLSRRSRCSSFLTVSMAWYLSHFSKKCRCSKEAPRGSASTWVINTQNMLPWRNGIKYSS